MSGADKECGRAFERLGIDPAALPADKSREYTEAQSQTSDTFGFKWSKRDTYESDRMREKMREWLLERYCESDERLLDAWLQEGPQLILDAGCGAGVSAILLFGERLRDHDYLGVDIAEDALTVARQRFRERGVPACFLAASLTDLPIEDGVLDIVFSEGVLHHTDSTEESLKYLSRKLKPGGRFLFYVYARKAPIREFTDDHVREYLQPMSNEDAWKALEPLTKLGMALGELNQELEVPEDIPYLGISRGRHDIQRLFYYTIAKAYYDPELTIDEMNHINFDWYRPANCHRHTEDEVRTFCRNAGLLIDRMVVQASGITVVAMKS